MYPPPGIIILATGAVLVGFTPWQWTPVLGILLGLFILAGFLLSPTGLSNLFGHDGMSVAFGQTIEVIGALVAVIAGAIATSRAVRAQAPARYWNSGGLGLKLSPPVVDRSHLLYGTDWPWSPEPGTRELTGALDRTALLHPDDRHRIYRQNALDLFPGLRQVAAP
jgi:amidohydrolase family protein